MKPAPFEYERAESVDHVLALLAEYGEEAKVLAGGQSLVPMLNFRLARPGRLIDINGLGELSYVRRREGMLYTGAMTRQALLERSATVRHHWPLMAEALSLVAHAQIRNRGTIGGSLAHADPAAELPVVLTALDGEVTASSIRGERTIPARDLFITHLTTSLEPDELLTEVRLPAPPARSGFAFCEYSRRHGDFGLGGAAVLLALDPDGRCERAAIALLAAAPTPVRAPAAEARLTGAEVDEALAREAASSAVHDVSPTGDIHGDARYRRRLIEALVRRAILLASQRGRTPEPPGAPAA